MGWGACLLRIRSPRRCRDACSGGDACAGDQEVAARSAGRWWIARQAHPVVSNAGVELQTVARHLEGAAASILGTPVTRMSGKSRIVSNDAERAQIATPPRTTLP